jgi:RES domain-containing protein
MASRHSGPLTAYRIADARNPLFDGRGAARWGGRWNSPGRLVIYAAASYAGALLEVLAHANIGIVPKHHAWIEVHIPHTVEVEEIAPADLPGWDAPDLVASRSFGDEWYDRGRTAVLLVPSLVARVECNVVINRAHAQFRKITASRPRPVIWDERLLR